MCVCVCVCVFIFFLALPVNNTCTSILTHDFIPLYHYDLLTTLLSDD